MIYLRAGSRAHHRHWFASKLGKLSGLREYAEKKYYRENSADDPAANAELRELVDKLRHVAATWAGGVRSASFGADSDADQVEDKSVQFARTCQYIVRADGDQVEHLKAFFRAGGFSEYYPKKNTVLRVTDAGWWARVLKREGRRRTEQALREIGDVSKQSGLYVSAHTLGLWREDQRRQSEALENAELCDVVTGEVIGLDIAAGAGVANLENRRAELMVRVRGMAEQAERLGLVPLFATLTAPSKYHAIRGNGSKNQKYNGSTPREAQAYLCRVWSRIRAALKRQGIGLAGLRVAEPHHDGCPHWHLLIFVRPLDRLPLIEIVTGYSLEEDGDEPGAEQRRLEWVELSSCGDAAGYIAKYVAKNVDGFKVGEDYESRGSDAKSTAVRVRCWASVWGIRQFQALGDAPVTVWRELRRVAADEEKSQEVEGVAAWAMEAADAGEWAEYSAVNGGLMCAREDRPLAPEYTEETPVTGRVRVGHFGDLCRAVMGVRVYGQRVIVSRWREWVLNFKRDSASRSCVNNCTALAGHDSAGFMYPAIAGG